MKVIGGMYPFYFFRTPVSGHTRLDDIINITICEALSVTFHVQACLIVALTMLPGCRALLSGSVCAARCVAEAPSQLLTPKEAQHTSATM